MLLPTRTYFQSEPTETRKNHMDRPHSQSATRSETTLIMGTLASLPRKPSGMMRSVWLPSLAGRWWVRRVRCWGDRGGVPRLPAVKANGPIEMNYRVMVRSKFTFTF